VVPRASLEQERNDVGPRIAVLGMEVRGPPDDVELVHVADAMNVTAGVEQGANDLAVASGGGPVQRIGVVACFTRIRIGAVIEQQPHNLQLAALCGGMQRGPSSVRLISVCYSDKGLVVAE
jgi:hypothetical protein